MPHLIEIWCHPQLQVHHQNRDWKDSHRHRQVQNLQVLHQ